MSSCLATICLESATWRGGKPQASSRTNGAVPSASWRQSPCWSNSSASSARHPIAGLQTLRHMSAAVAGMLSRGLEPATEASVVKDLSTTWEQALPAIARAQFEHALARAILIAPKLTIQGGTTEILRGIIARGLGLR